MAHPRETTTVTPAFFDVRVGSRHPRLGTDYDPVIHKYTKEYLEPPSYQIFINAFPGGTSVRMNDGEVDTTTQRLAVSRATSGFEFVITGRVASKIPVGPRTRPFTATKTKVVHATSGQLGFFAQVDAPWECTFDVPGPGEFNIAVRTLGSPGPGEPRTRKFKVRDRLVVSIGDSAASGQGNPDVPGKPAGYDPDLGWFDVLASVLVPGAVSYVLTREVLEYAWDRINRSSMTIARALDFTLEMDPEPVWLEANAYRSLRSGPAYAARMLEDRGAGSVVTFLPFGRTGSTIQKGLLARRSDLEDQWIGAVGQVEEVVRAIGKKRIDALLIQIGINDLDATGTLRDLLQSDLYRLELMDRRQEARERTQRLAFEKMDEMPANLDQLKTALEALNVRHVYLTEYTTALFDVGDGQVGRGCELFDELHPLEISPADARMLKGLAEELNRRLRDQANRLGWFYISGIASAFSGHGYCTGEKRRYFVRAQESLASQGDTEGTIHPNALGSQVIGAAIASTVKRHTFDVADGIDAASNQAKAGPRLITG